MATIQRLLVMAEFHLTRSRDKTFSNVTSTIEKEAVISQAASLLAIARSLNHIIDHGIGPGPLPVLSDEERKALKAVEKEGD